MKRGNVENKRPLWNAETVAALALLAGVAGIFYFSRDYPSFPGQFSGSPAFWPRLVASVLGVMAVFILVGGLVKPMHTTRPSAANLVKLIVVVAVLYASRWSLEWIGFMPSAALLMLTCMLVLTRKEDLTVRAVLTIAGASLGVSYVLYFVLFHVARIPLPRGTLL